MGQAAYHCGDQADPAQLPSQFCCSLPTGQPAFLGGSSSPWLRWQPFVRMLSEGTSPTAPVPMSRIWFNLFSLLWIWGVAWLSGIKREIRTGCCAIEKKKVQSGLMLFLSLCIPAFRVWCSFPELPWACVLCGVVSLKT